MKHIIIYGDFWADCRAVIAIIQNRYSGINTTLCSNITELIVFLSRYPDAGLVLCLRPHEHVFILSSAALADEPESAECSGSIIFYRPVCHAIFQADRLSTAG